MGDIFRNWPKSKVPVRSTATPGRLFDLQRLASHPRVDNEAAVRAACASAYLGDATAVCRVLGRYKMFVDTGDVGLSSHLMLDGYWEMWLTEAMARIVRPGMTVADVGANLGYFTLLMADLVGPQGHVHAFEPNPPIAARLRRSVSVNGFVDRVTTHEQALSDEDGTEVLLVTPAGEPKNAYIAPPGGRGLECGDRLIRTRRLDSYRDIASVEVVKIDADTAEEAIWRGMRGLLAANRLRVVFLEFAPARYADAGAFLDVVTGHGFALHVVDLDHGVQPTTRARILEGSPFDDRMLVLRR